MFNNKIDRLKLISLIIIMQLIALVICYYCLNIIESFKYNIIVFCSILVVATIIFFISYNLKSKEIKKLKYIINEHEEMINKLIVYKRAEEEQFELLSDVSHELRTPLTSIIGFAKIINRRLNKVIIPFITNENKYEQNDKSETSKAILGINKISENIEIIISESERLTSLINNLLDFSKLRADNIDWKLEKTDLREIISKGILISYSLLDNKDLELNDEIDENIPLVYVDKNKILQVIINLLSNAIKFTERGKIICRAQMYNENEVLISVEDTGVGIPEQYYKKIFRRFEQIPNSSQRSQGSQGSGLGLVICKAIVEKHGGRIWLESEINKGSIFYFTIPVNQVEGE